MYAEFYGLQELPFNITPDPRFLYLNDCYQEALAALAYGIEARKGFISLIGEAGTGKTTLLRHLLDTLDPRIRTVLLLNPTVSFDEILEHILTELGIPTDGGGKLVLLQRLNEFLLEHTSAGGNVVLMIDEAQDLATGALEELRLLSNLETAREKILQIVLAGQPELEKILRNPALRQLRQRVTLNVRVRPLTTAEVRAYVRTRLELTGARTADVFMTEAVDRVAELSRGIPRLVNVLCDASLMMGFVGSTKPVTAAIVDAAWKDYSLEAEPEPEPTPPAAPPQIIGVPVTAEQLLAMLTSPVAVAAPAPETPQAPAAVEPEQPVRTEAAPVESPLPEPAADDAVETAPLVAAEAAPAEEPTPVAEESAAPPEPAVADVLPEPPAEAAPPAPEPQEPRPAPRPVRKAAAPTPRATFSIPSAAALVAALAVGIYALSIQDDDADRLAPVAVASQPAADDPAPEPGTAVAATPPAGVAPTPVAPAGPTPLVEVIRPDGTPITAAEATAVVDRFRAAYEARDVDRLVSLFAHDAVENGRQGLDAITASYRTTLGNLADVHYTLPSLAVSAGPQAAVRAPFLISYEQASGEHGEIKGDAEWQLERRDGRIRITSLIYRLGSPG